jgi:hypothetical protein
MTKNWRWSTLNGAVLGLLTNTLIDTPLGSSWLGTDWSHIQSSTQGLSHAQSIIYSQIVLITRLCSSSN